MSQSIRIASCGWDAPFEEFCAVAARAGYAGIETSLDTYAGRKFELRALLDRYGLSIAASSAGGLFLDPATREADMAAVVETAARLSDFGVFTLEMHTGPRPVGGPSEDQIARYAEALNELGRRCRPLGVDLGVHNHCIQFIETEREIDALYRRLDPAWVGLGFDTGHLALAGCEPSAIFQRYIDYGFRVAYLHLKDLYQVSKPAGDGDRVMTFDEVLGLAVSSDTLTWLVIQDIDGRRIVLGGGRLGHDFLRAHRDLIRGVRCRDITEYQFAEIGQGVVDFKTLFDVLRAAGYDGWAAVELDVAYRPRFDSAKLSREYIRHELSA